MYRKTYKVERKTTWKTMTQASNFKKLEKEEQSKLQEGIRKKIIRAEIN